MSRTAARFSTLMYLKMEWELLMYIYSNIPGVSALTKTSLG